MIWRRVREMFRTRTAPTRPPQSSPSDLERAQERGVQQSERIDRIVDSYQRASHAIRR